MPIAIWVSTSQSMPTWREIAQVRASVTGQMVANEARVASAWPALRKTGRATAGVRRQAHGLLAFPLRLLSWTVTLGWLVVA